MIIVDTNVWIDHFASPNERLRDELAAFNVLCHPYIIGEIALGSVKDRRTVVEQLVELDEPPIVALSEFLDFVERYKLHSRGIGFVDCHLVASARLMPGTQIWTNDKRLSAVACEMNLAFDAPVTRLN